MRHFVYTTFLQYSEFAASKKQVLPRVVSPRQALSDTPNSAYQGKGSWSPSEGQPRSRTRLLAHVLGGRQLPTSSSCSTNTVETSTNAFRVHCAVPKEQHNRLGGEPRLSCRWDDAAAASSSTTASSHHSYRSRVEIPFTSPSRPLSSLSSTNTPVITMHATANSSGSSKTATISQLCCGTAPSLSQKSISLGRILPLGLLLQQQR
jgi:hypothetical protein